jgi:hypothetical protein
MPHTPNNLELLLEYDKRNPWSSTKEVVEDGVVKMQYG